MAVAIRRFVSQQNRKVTCTVPVIDRRTNESVERIRAEFLEMPGLCLTRRQMRRLLMLDADVCNAAVDGLVASGFLRRRDDNTFVRADGQR